MICKHCSQTPDHPIHIDVTGYRSHKFEAVKPVAEDWAEYMECVKAAMRDAARYRRLRALGVPKDNGR